MTVSGRDIAAHHKPERNHKNSKEKKLFFFGDGTAKIFSGFDDSAAHHKPERHHEK